MSVVRPGHARHRLDDVIHAPVRLSIVAGLASVDEAEFATVRDAVEVSDSVLSKQVAALEAAGYVKVRKGYVGRRPRTWLSLTRSGREALARHVAALQEIAGAPAATVASGDGLAGYGSGRGGAHPGPAARRADDGAGAAEA